MTTSEIQILPVVPLRSIVPLPGAMLPIEIGRAASVSAIKTAHDDDDQILLVPQLDADTLEPGAAELFDVGLLAEIIQLVNHNSNHITAIVRIDKRIRVSEFIEGMSYLAAHVEPFEDVVRDLSGEDADPEAAELLQQMIVALTPVVEEIDDSEADTESSIDLQDPDHLVNVATQHVEIPRDEMLDLLAEPDPVARLRKVLPYVSRMHEVVRMGADIRDELMGDASAEAREKVLRERMKAIKQELGEESEDEQLDEYADQVRESKMPEEVRKAALKEISRLRHMQQASPQYNVSQTYVERLLEVPWGIETEDTLDVAAARAILDAEHSGLAKVKKRILEFIAVRKLVPDKQGPILCLVGPPGVGKTSLGRSIASSLGRKYVRAALGGVRDESEIRGHRRTYIGALPGRIASSLMKAHTMNPVFVLDEVDKLGSDSRGDPTSAMLEVLDPEQNNTFVDHYLEVPLDLSRVMFIATANQLGSIPLPLRDRMEIIQVPSYTRVEKRTIAREHLLPKQMAEHGLSKDNMSLDDGALDELISGYTREAGVRNLEREIGAVCRSIAVRVASGKTQHQAITADDLPRLLGPAKHHDDSASRSPEIGVTTGMAWTPTGGDILFIEVRSMPGKGRLRLTGQVGDVMTESAQTALSWIRANGETLGIDSDVFQNRDLHIHLPAGAVRKDGPSAGVALTTALVSLLTDRPVRHDVSITGEVTLRGKVLAVGGVKEKVLAAHRAGIKTILLPKRNMKDLLDVPKHVLDELQIYPLTRVEEAFEYALVDGTADEQPPTPPAPPTPVGAMGGDSSEGVPTGGGAP